MTAMPRLVELSLDRRGVVDAELSFDVGAGEGLRQMRGRVRAELHVTCQRCLEPMTLVLEIEPRLILLRPGEREELAQQEDALVVTRAVPLSELVEDELLLAMPMIPKHALAQCPAKGRVGQSEPAPPTRGNPFAALKAMKRKDR